MQLVSNYLDKLESYLPEELQQEVREELEASIYGQIEDKQQELQRELTTSEQEQLLKKIGHPMRVASAYLPHQELISNDFFPAYKKALEIALIIMTLFVLFFSIPFVFSERGIIGSVITIFANLIDKGLYVFAIVTAIFYVLQTSNMKVDELYAWSPSQLYSSVKTLSLSRLETAFEILVYSLFLAWWNSLFPWPTEFFQEGYSVYVSLSNEWQQVHLSINVIMLLSIAVCIHKFIIAGWSKFSLAVDMALALASFVIIYQILQFGELVVINRSETLNLDWDFVNTTVHNIIYTILAVVAIICAWDIYSNFKKVISGRL